MPLNNNAVRFPNINLRIHLLTLTLTIFFITSNAQLKFIVEDFEGFSDGTTDLKNNGVFSYGNIKATIDYHIGHQQPYSGERSIRTYQTTNSDGTTKKEFGGWGKGISLYVEIDPNRDYLNFYVLYPSKPQMATNSTATSTSETETLKIELQEDDNQNGVYEKESDDSWVYKQIVKQNTDWQLISIPLNKFQDSNSGGDGAFNVSYAQGKLLGLIFSFTDVPIQNGAIISKLDQTWSFDFICFSQGMLPTGTALFAAPSATGADVCSLGAWSKEGNSGNFVEIATNFENSFHYGSEKKLGVVHFFQAFSTDGTSHNQHYPSIENINKIIEEGYIPMVTLEDHFVNLSSNGNTNVTQPNLYSIVEGHFDTFLANWAKQIKEVKGNVLLRILHEFNGDWYPWCTINNDKNPELVIKAFRHIHGIFKKQQATNVKFVWCPNSMSLPQEKWNFIMAAYPGDEFVDFVGLDIYNGAGNAQVLWRSFRKEGIENYFILTQRLPLKPLLICEVASRERRALEPKSSQNKSNWIKQMSDALTSDMAKVKLLTWFNEKETFKINSSSGAKGAYLDFILKNDHFKSGTRNLKPLLNGH